MWMPAGHEAGLCPGRTVRSAPQAEEGHHVFAENRKGISYDTLFGHISTGRRRIIVTDPYIRIFYQHET